MPEKCTLYRRFEAPFPRANPSKTTQMELTDLKPEALWRYFEAITKVPRPSKREAKIQAFLLDFARQHQLDAEQDEAGNIIIRKAAHPDMADRKTIALQSHMDMVCEKHSTSSHDFDKDPIQTYIADGWVHARDTTLGADDGIGVAAQMAVLADPELLHGPIECLFTSDEESGLTGAFGLKAETLKGSILLNLDSEDDAELYIGCAGGMDTTASFDVKLKPKVSRHQYYRLQLKGLKGGHSGDEIHKGLGNAIKWLNRFLWMATQEHAMRLSHFEGGNLRNAIPREAWAVVAVPEQNREAFVAVFDAYSETMRTRFADIEPNASFSLEPSKGQRILGRKMQARILRSVYACPHGELRWSRSLSNLVETSTNLAAIRWKANRVEVLTSQRSSVEDGLKDAATRVAAVFELAGASVKHGMAYPGWEPKLDSEILKIGAEAHKQLFGTEPAVKAIHAGLECGLFLTKYPDMDMVSFGPTIRGAHSPDERVEIAAVERFWQWLIEILKQTPVA